MDWEREISDVDALNKDLTNNSIYVNVREENLLIQLYLATSNNKVENIKKIFLYVHKIMHD